MKNFTVISLLSLLFVFCNCQKETKYELPEAEPKISMGAYIFRVDSMVHDSSVYIRPTELHIGESSSVFDKEGPLTIKADAVKLYENNVFVDTFSHRSSWQNQENYSIEYTFQPGNNYRIVASKAGLGEASAEVYMPDEVPLTMAEWDTSSNILRFAFEDVPGRDYYSFRIGSSSAWGLESFFMPFEKLDPEIYFFTNYEFIIGNPLSNLENTGEQGFFTDESFDGKEKLIEVRIIPREQPKDIYVYLNHISPDMYEYLRSMSAYLKTRDNPFAEKVKIHNNVENGYGIVGAATPSRMEAIKK